jgi:hypothetical protein
MEPWCQSGPVLRRDKPGCNLVYYGVIQALFSNGVNSGRDPGVEMKGLLDSVFQRNDKVPKTYGVIPTKVGIQS